MADERVAYPDSSRRSEQLSCTWFILYDFIYEVLNISEVLELNLIQIKKMAMGTEECTQECVRVHDMWGWRAQLTQSTPC